MVTVKLLFICMFYYFLITGEAQPLNDIIPTDQPNIIENETKEESREGKFFNPSPQQQTTQQQLQQLQQLQLQQLQQLQQQQQQQYPSKYASTPLQQQQQPTRLGDFDIDRLQLETDLNHLKQVSINSRNFGSSYEQDNFNPYSRSGFMRASPFATILSNIIDFIFHKLVFIVFGFSTRIIKYQIGRAILTMIFDASARSKQARTASTTVRPL